LQSTQPRASAVALLALSALTILVCGAALAQSVTLAGSLGDSKALLVIDGQPHTLAVGQSVGGVTLLRLRDGQAEVSVGGQRSVLIIGAGARLNGTAAVAPAAREIVLSAGLGGHFISAGAINGRAVQFMVDTGATSIAMGMSEAQRLGLNFKDGQLGRSSTANGTVAVWHVKLGSVRIGDVEVHDVSASVLPAGMPYVLLGNSFLSRFQMKRDNDQMVLERRY
jgi:aspartyl protease family protein